MLNQNNMTIRAIELASTYNITISVATIILLNGYTLCQDDMITTKDLNTNETMSK
jgi:hypothetical protein